MKNLFTPKLFKLSCLLITLVMSATSAIAGGRSVAEINSKLSRSMALYNSKIVVGGDFSLDFVASAPLTYNHQTGGGFYDDRTIGRDKDVVESLEGGDFSCGDYVTYLTKITVSATAIGSQTIELDYSFLAAATGQPGVALGAIRTAQVNIGDPAIIDNGTIAMASLNGGYDIITGDGGTITGGNKFTKPATLNGTVTVSGLNAGDVIIVRVDVRIDCQFPSSPTGNLQASLPAGRALGFSGKAGTISVGKQTVPFKNVNLIQSASCSLSANTPACIDEVKTFTVTRIPPGSLNTTYAWSFTTNSGGATFVQSNGSALATPNTPGSVATVYVKAASAGSYTVSVIASEAGFANTSCSQLVTVNAALAEPTDNYNAPACDSDKFSVTISNVVAGVTYSILDKCGNAISGVMAGGLAQSSYTPSTTANFDFSNIQAGSGYQIVASKDGCVSPAASCGSTTNCPPARIGSPAAKPQTSIDKANEKTIKAFPVPFSDKVTIEFKSKKAESYVINLYDMQGKLVKQLAAGNANAGEITRFEVDGKGMIESMYLVRKVSRSGVETVKLLKKD